MVSDEPITLVAYVPQWPARFECERADSQRFRDELPFGIDCETVLRLRANTPS